MSSIVLIIDLILPEVAAILKLVITNPAKYANLKSVFVTAQGIVNTIKADLDTIVNSL